MRLNCNEVVHHNAQRCSPEVSFWPPERRSGAARWTSYQKRSRLKEPIRGEAAVAEANKRGSPLNVAVVDFGGNLVTFARMDGAQLASIAISEHKARVAAKYRRPTKAIEEGVQKGITILMTFDDVIASRGGIPLIEDGKLIGAIGCSGATGSQDEVVCSAGAASINR